MTKMGHEAVQSRQLSAWSSSLAHASLLLSCPTCPSFGSLRQPYTATFQRPPHPSRSSQLIRVYLRDPELQLSVIFCPQSFAECDSETPLEAMRLLRCDDGKLALTTDLVDDIPPYAILSHTWGPDTEEVTFKDVVNGTGQEKVGYSKIRFCADQARHDSLQYFWVDTCCIDKSNNNELHAAINSMFRWYQNAARCYVYLGGIPAVDDESSQQPRPAWESAFRAHRWFTRGWTLQELLAPRSVEFFTQDHRRLGDKKTLEQQICEITGIPKQALRNYDLGQFGTDERFRWADTRQTRLEEDSAYSLLGIFGVFMPLIYGEGKAHAVRRLRREIADAASRDNEIEHQRSIQPSSLSMPYLY